MKRWRNRRLKPVDARQATRTRAETWASRQRPETGAQAKAPITPEKQRKYEEELGLKARQLVTHVVLAGEWYLVRWGGTRKGSGTFYTRPGLAVPTVYRTLRPLAYTPPSGADGRPKMDAPAADWAPKTEEIPDHHRTQPVVLHFPGGCAEISDRRSICSSPSRR